jgi:hypothetical protein
MAVTIVEIADALERAPRQGTDKDKPEGSRFATFSDTALNQMARDLRLAAGDRPDAKTFGGGRR